MSTNNDPILLFSCLSTVTPVLRTYDLEDIHLNHKHVTIVFHPSSMTKRQKEIFYIFLTEYAGAALNGENDPTPSGAPRDTAMMSRMPGAPPPPPTSV